MSENRAKFLALIGQQLGEPNRAGNRFLFESSDKCADAAIKLKGTITNGRTAPVVMSIFPLTDATEKVQGAASVASGSMRRTKGAAWLGSDSSATIAYEGQPKLASLPALRQGNYCFMPTFSRAGSSSAHRVPCGRFRRRAGRTALQGCRGRFSSLTAVCGRN